ncbi:cysteine--tRNA ligase [Patescibacteria group bacterium]|nr:cysteine--tRNA ligase [Patescibacteria group bacterium]
MPQLKIYNTLTRQIESFRPINPPEVGMYSCGPTVYDNQHIGHMRRYVGDDILIRVLSHNGYQVKQVMNITDVGHLISDSDTGEDKMEKGSRRFGLSVWDLAKKFERQFWDSMNLLNIGRPNEVMHATDYIKEQIKLVQTLERKGYTYKVEDGIYFDTSKFEPIEKLTKQKSEELMGGARVEMVKGKKNPTDFALWKFSYPNGRPFDPDQDSLKHRRQMEWDSPWGLGFPGWHIECSAMSMKALGQSFDIHTGGIDHISIHHTNEIIQSEAATGRQFVKYWVHHGFLLVDGRKMSKSLGNTYTEEDVIKNGFDPLALRYLYLQTHYRQEMNFTWESLKGAQISLERLRGEIAGWDSPKIGCSQYEEKFAESINDDLNMPKALAVMWDLVRSDYPTSAKSESLSKFDEVLGLGLSQGTGDRKQETEIPPEILEMVRQRKALRENEKFALADEIRLKIRKMGWEIEDRGEETLIRKIKSPKLP